MPRRSWRRAARRSSDRRRSRPERAGTGNGAPGRSGDRFLPIHGRFGDLPSLLSAHGVPRCLAWWRTWGVSSMQLDQAERGFSFMRRGPIDMRMDTASGETALDLIGRLPAEKLADLIYHYGERASRRIAAGLKQAHDEGALVDTLALAEVIRRLNPSRDRNKHPATRTFQALRIAVNDELGSSISCSRMPRSSWHRRAPGDRHLPLARRSTGQAGAQDAPWAPLHRRALSSKEEELAVNRRARSAHVRAAERCEVAA